MSQIHSQQSNDNDDAGRTRERVLNASRLVPLTAWEEKPDLYTDQFPIVPGPEQSGKLFTEPLTSISAPLQAMHTTQSLVITLQSPKISRTSKAPVVIPGSRRRTPQTEKLSAPRRLHPSVRLGSVTVVMLSILLFTLFSLAPLSTSQSSIPLFNGAIRWAEEQQVTWDGIVTRIKQAEQPPATSTTTITPPAPPVPNNPPVAPDLPRGAYVDVARQAAIRYGISPDSFIRQIQQESHFDPNAQSPSGAVGIAQFIPSTAASIGVNPYDPVSALNGAARLMSSLAGQFGGDYAKALAAYNAGPGAVQHAVNIGGAGWLAYMPPETQHYVRTIMG
jgi:hypothetical protein